MTTDFKDKGNWVRYFGGWRLSFCVCMHGGTQVSSDISPRTLLEHAEESIYHHHRFYFYIYISLHPSPTTYHLLHPYLSPLMALIPVLISITALALAYKLYQRLRFKLPPGPHPWPILGNLGKIKPVRFRCFAEWSQTYGPIMSVWLGSNLHVIV